MNIRLYNENMPHHRGDDVREKWYIGMKVAFVPKDMWNGYFVGTITGHIYNNVLFIEMESKHTITISTFRCCPLELMPNAN